MCHSVVEFNKKYIKLFLHLRARQCAECIFVLQDDVLLEVEDIYHLLLEFPKTVIEDTATAIFNKKTRRLTLKVDVVLTN